MGSGSADGQGDGGCVMSRERTDNEILLDYTDLFGPGRERQCESPLKTSNCRPGRSARAFCTVHDERATRDVTGAATTADAVGAVSRVTGCFRLLGCNGAHVSVYIVPDEPV